ncbi:Retrovirus-related Pol polyprotein from transposon 17.6 [Nosema granulosis]|uniref:Retrovirus-related Pol polyprotein from transposon 17.6 n=1 Tax=Nosema granulosis TaxID=83296 RepID=A0A9P6KYD2_9MICR|nr:Retrovirus-related Pol polyprotein from transposon 17.6 [Nosema granulosis]
MLVVLWAMEHFRYFLLDRKFKVFSDHKALEALTSKGCINSARISRWMERIQAFDFEVIYKESKELQHVDALSRCRNEVNDIENNLDEIIIQAHTKLVHGGGKATYEYLKESQNIREITMKRVKQAFARCKRCKEYNPMRIDGFRYIEAFEPGRRLLWM